ncbi:hypothetical protein ACFOG5_10835 [Pedobacter fastidiosus]|uniref:hypothetical protein n=1 Tax=Pedobacter fastidiosus TaxID=2765361 RepID=UPI0036103918
MKISITLYIGYKQYTENLMNGQIFKINFSNPIVNAYKRYYGLILREAFTKSKTLLL